MHVTRHLSPWFCGTHVHFVKIPIFFWGFPNCWDRPDPSEYAGSEVTCMTDIEMSLSLTSVLVTHCEPYSTLDTSLIIRRSRVARVTHGKGESDPGPSGNQAIWIPDLERSTLDIWISISFSTAEKERRKSQKISKGTKWGFSYVFSFNVI